jgi:hypothetical protein
VAFLKKRSKIPAALLKGVIILVTIVVIAGGLYYLYRKHTDDLTKLHEDEIGKYRSQLYLLERKVFVPKEDIEYGAVISAEMFDQVNMKIEFSQDQLLDESDMGKTSIVKLPKGLPVTKSSVVSVPPADDIRKVEFNMFLIQTDQQKGDYVDIRIVFPNAENYIVLGKKQIKEIKPADNIIWVWLNETEIHLISSAIIDAYLNPGTKIYATTYVQPEMQTAATSYYPPNQYVLDLMRKDPNILSTASDALARQAREVLESHLERISVDEAAMVSGGVNEEITKTTETIKNEELNKAMQDRTELQQQSPEEESPFQ